MDCDTLLFFSTRRSGHHAVMNWFLHQAPFNTTFYNDVPYDYIIKGEIPKIIAKIRYNENLEKHVDCFNFELTPISKLDKIKESDLINGNVKEIIILRDIYNTMASTLRRFKRRQRNQNIQQKTVSDLRDLWIEQAKAILDGHDHILFNRWFSDEEYRKKICEDMLDVEYSEKGLQDVPKFGEGSSYDAMSKNHKAQKMDVLNRYKNVVDKNLYTLYCHGDEIRKLNKELFGFAAV